MTRGVRSATKKPEQYEKDLLRGFARQALGEWLYSRRGIEVESIPVPEIDSAMEGIRLGVDVTWRGIECND